MRRSISIITAMVIGFLAMFMLLRYYYVSKEFRQSYKEVASLFAETQQEQERITYGVLQSALFAYYNQDTIARDRRLLKERVRQMREVSLLTQGLYAPLQEELGKLVIKTDAYLERVEDYLIINAGIKNSYVFLSTFEARAHELFHIDSLTTRTIHTIVDEVMQAKRMLDNGYIKDLSAKTDLLRSGDYDDTQKTFIAMFITHADYMREHYRAYLQTFSDIIETPLRADLESAKKHFERLSEQDSIFLDRLALFLFLLIFIALITIIALLIHLQKENRDLLLAKQQLRHALRHDPLTGLYNRNSFEEGLMALRHPTILLLNISGFKMINDFYGSLRGDEILRKVSRQLLRYIDGTAIQCFRIGGDEFALLFEETEKSAIMTAAQDIDRLLTNTTYVMDDLELTIDMNMAISSTLPVLETADMALKQLKSQPVDRIIHYTPSFDVERKIRHNIEMTQTIRDALKHDRIHPYYQPIIDLETREIVKYEVLMRLEKSDGSILLPNRFLSISQQTPLYRELSRAIINKSLLYFADRPYRFSINLSMRDLEDDDIINTLLGQLSVRPEVAARLDIELLESHDLSDIEKVKDFIAKVRTFGCKIAIDDFGSGYSNFSYLSELDIDIVKIDGSLIKDIMTDNQRLETVKAIMRLLSSLDIESIAEYVQDERSARMLHSLGVDYAQGFYFGKPDADIVELADL